MKSFDCPLCNSTFATEGDGRDWRKLAGIRLVEHLATTHQMSAREAWAAATPVLCDVAPSERERESSSHPAECGEWQDDDVVALTELAMELTTKH